MLDEYLEFWRRLDTKRAPCIHPGDKPLLLCKSFAHLTRYMYFGFSTPHRLKSVSGAVNKILSRHQVRRSKFFQRLFEGVRQFIPTVGQIFVP
jgi:hypothetical protein